MANRVKLIKYHDGFQLHINGLVAVPNPASSSSVKAFTETTYPAVLTEVETYLASTEGLERLGGSFADLTATEIKYITEVTSDSTSFDGTNNYKIEFISLI